jgi:hypothetical protein
MQDQLDKLVDQAAECALIASRAANKSKRDLFRRLAMHYSARAFAVERAIAEAAGDGEQSIETEGPNNRVRPSE